MVEILRGDANVFDRKLAFHYFMILHVCGERVQRDREVGVIHLRREHFAERLAKPARPVNVPLIARHKERREERQALDMIPMRVRDEDVAAGAAALLH